MSDIKLDEEFEDEEYDDEVEEEEEILSYENCQEIRELVSDIEGSLERIKQIIGM